MQYYRFVKPLRIGGRAMITLKNSKENMIANNLEPAHATHPGIFIKGEIISRGLSQKQLAQQMGVSVSLLNEILNQKRALNTEMAMLIEAALDIPALALLNMQTEYDMLMAKRDHPFVSRLNDIRKIVALL